MSALTREEGAFRWLSGEKEKKVSLPSIKTSVAFKIRLHSSVFFCINDWLMVKPLILGNRRHWHSPYNAIRLFAMVVSKRRLCRCLFL